MKRTPTPKQQYDKERKRLAQAAWKAFSSFKRSYDATFAGYNHCYTCFRTFPWKELDAGHFRHTRKKDKIRVKEIDYEPRNIHPQCTRCNRMIHGNLAKYAQNLVRDYGPEVLRELDLMYLDSRDLTNEELAEIIKRYETK